MIDLPFGRDRAGFLFLLFYEQPVRICLPLKELYEEYIVLSALMRCLLSY